VQGGITARKFFGINAHRSSYLDRKRIGDWSGSGKLRLGVVDKCVPASLLIMCAVCAMCAQFAGMPSSANAQVTRNVAVECDAFEKNAIGSWTLNRETTVSEGIYGFILNPGTFRRNEKNVFGYDLIGVLEKDCVKVKPKKK
jgi:hypothetical protein